MHHPHPPHPPPSPIDPGAAERAVRTVERILPLLRFGPPLLRRGPLGEAHVDLPLLYNGVALDRVHFDPERMIPLPKGAPHPASRILGDPREIVERANLLLEEARVLGAAEYRGPERAWAVPLAWRAFIIALVRVDWRGEEVVPDYGLTAELGRSIL